MKNRDPKRTDPVRVYFLGSGEIGVPVLNRLLEDPRIELVGIGTQPDRPAGRNRRLLATPVGVVADRLGGDVDKPASVNCPDFLAVLRQREPEVLAVVSFGQILKTDVLNLPAFGCLNAHASLLPRHRGASPVNAAILLGDHETGISFMNMDEGLDTGPVYERHRIGLRGDETAGDLADRLALLAARNIVECIWRVCREHLAPVAQNQHAATYARKLCKQDGRIDWTAPAEMIERQTRGLYPWPRAYTFVCDKNNIKRLQLTAVAVRQNPTREARPGEIVQAGDSGWIVSCGDQALEILRVIPEGRGEMAAIDFLRGHAVEKGWHLHSDVEGVLRHK